MIGKVMVIVFSTLMVLVQCIKWFLLGKTAKAFSVWEPDPEGESITQEMDIRQIRWMENISETEYEVHTRGKKVYTFNALPFTELCKYFEKRGMTELRPITDNILINIRHISDISIDGTGDGIIRITGIKRKFRVAKPYAKGLTWWSYEK